MSTEENDGVVKDDPPDGTRASHEGTSTSRNALKLPRFRSAPILRKAVLRRKESEPLELKSRFSLEKPLGLKSRFSPGKPLVYSHESLWPVQKVDEVPYDYSIARTSRLITNTNVDEICKRITRVLKKSGIKAEYDAARAVAKCETSYFVKFNVRLFRGKGKFSDGTIVEVRRTYNSSLEFMADCRSILNAAQGVKDFDFKIRPKKPISQLDCVKHFGQTQSTDYVKEALDCSEKHVQSECADVKILGLESIISLLDQNNCSCSTVKRVYQSVLMGETHIGIQKAVVSYLTDYSGLEDDKYKLALRRLSLQVVYKSFHASQCLCREGCGKALKENPWLVDSFVNILINDLKNVKSNPHNALTALKCFSIMVTISTTVRENALSYGLVPAVRVANEHSKLFCDKIFKESENLLKEFNVH